LLSQKEVKELASGDGSTDAKKKLRTIAEKGERRAAVDARAPVGRDHRGVA
jgi:hypothetical protein